MSRVVTCLVVAFAFALGAAGVRAQQPSPPTPSAQDAPPQQRPPGDPHAGDAFLRLLDQKKYGEAWDASSDLCKQSVSRAEWIQQMVKTRDPIGEVAQRTLMDAMPEKDPQGAPAGDYLLMTYKTVFASQGKPYTETLPMVKGPDGVYRAVGYFLR